MIDERWDRELYEQWLATLRMGGDVLAEEEERGTPVEDRTLTALNIQIAWVHLNDPTSPFRNLITDADRRTFEIARRITGDVGTEVM